MDGVRLFVALELPPQVVGALEQWQAAMLAEDGELRRVGGDALHVTLCFLGSRPASEVDAIGAACEAAVGRATITGLALGDAVWLPSQRRPNVLAIAIVDPNGALAALQRSVAQSLAAIGTYAPEPRRYLAHVTVARVRRGGAMRSAPEPPAGRFDAPAVSLFRSHLGDGPARYERLRSVPLGRA